jgi:crossover junction endodeoxyribonuclease RusA
VIFLTLPYPVSSNRYWTAITIPGRTMMAPSKEAKAYKAEVARIARAAGLAKPMVCRVEMWIRLYPARPQDWARRARLDPAGWDDDVRCMDLGNCEKVLSDALQGIIYVDDKRIWHQDKRRMEPDANGARVELAIRPMAKRAVPQADLLGQAA